MHDAQPSIDLLLPGTDALTRGEAYKRLKNWKDFITPLYKGAGVNPPMGVFIPVADILAMAEYFKQSAHTSMKGIRGYYALKSPQDSSGLTGEITLLIVPTNEIPDKPIEFSDDVCIPVESIASDEDKQLYSIYDVTRPCPPCCGDLYDLLEKYHDSSERTAP